MNNIIFTADETLYVKAKEYCRKLKPELRDDLFYALLDWCDQHDEIRNRLAKKTDAYDVLYIDKNGKSHEESFTIHNGGDPYRLARKRYIELLSDSVQVAELRHRPNPYLSGPERMGHLILSYEKNEETKS